jgi:quercetin dioxygenase-like cupin family protein
MRKMLILVGAACVSGVVANAAIGGATAQAQPVKRTELQRVDVSEMEGREGVMYIAEIAPGAAAGRHFHPGPEYLYVLEGTMILEPDGQPPVTLRKGETGHQHARHLHNARNGSPSEPLRVLVFLLSEKGQPLATLVEPPAGAQ